ncbi:MAG: bifunctional riboflavin kinase/FAD synthetase [Catalinimonas sp.]
MNVYHGLAAFERLPHAVVTSGTFDGVHVGHQKILARLRERADANGGQTVLLTYWPHPRLVLRPDDRALRLLSTLEEKTHRLARFGVDHLIIIPFTRDFSRLSSETFIRKVLVEGIGTGTLVIGYDHRFGRNREGSFEHLREHAPTWGFAVEEIPRQDVDDVGVSSTKVRQALLEGRVSLANEYLGDPYPLTGTVVRGEQRGRQIDFPTANLAVAEPHKLIPAEGVYAVRAGPADAPAYRWAGMMNIGRRPTVGTSQERSIEVHLFDYTGDLYGQTLRVGLVDLIRAERRFEGMEALRRQLERDRTVIRDRLARYS